MKKFLIIIILAVISSNINAQRIKDIAFIKGIQSEQLIGYGLVVGLAGTGDSYRSSFTVQSVISMLKRFGITVPETNLRTRNVAAVMITARVSNLIKPGSNFDIIVSSMGDATSLTGSILLMTPLSGVNGKVYGIAQGPVSVGGYDISTESGGRIAKNHTLTGRIPNGGAMELPIMEGNIDPSNIGLVLNQPDFTTLNNVVNAINSEFGAGTALAESGSEVKINLPAGQNDIVSFMARLEAIEVQRDAIAKVVLNERTGTVVTGDHVRISPVTISHGSLNISVRSYPVISQPGAFSQGQTSFFNNLVPSVEQENTKSISIEGATNVQEVAAALNQLKVSPHDIIAIFQALKEAGALTAELVIL
ncbi:MAG: flagellar basal body P-ring protein FlgI [Bacteroidetes bacterium]|nr:flagellar basal body P-ring protein FlgI [Bacteroidota bacterium]